MSSGIAQAIETEMDIISSRIFAGKVVDAMNLVEHPWFNTYLAQRSDAARSDGPLGLLAGIVGTLFGEDESERSFNLPSTSAQRDRAISSLLGNMSVTRSGDSFAVTVRVTTPDPELSATLANTIADIYVDWSRELRKQTMSDAVVFLRGACRSDRRQNCSERARDHRLPTRKRSCVQRS